MRWIERTKKAAAAFIAVSVSVFLALCAGEFLIRRMPGVEVRWNFEQYKAVESKAIVPGSYRPSKIPGLGYELNPAGKPWINRHGLIGREYGLAKDPSCFRIMVLGDSITERHWYVEKLEEMLNAGCAGGRRFELWNAGVGGYNIDQYYYCLKYKLMKFNPDMVIIGMDLNDFTTSTVVCYIDSDGGIAKYRPPLYGLSEELRTNPFFLRHSYLYRFLLSAQCRFLRRRNGYPEMDGEYYLRGIKTLCEKRNIPLICFVFPLLKSSAEYTPDEKREAVRIVDALREMDVDHLELDTFFSQEKRPALRCEEDAHDFVHPNREGHNLAAQAMYVYLRNRYFKCR